jgi:hypothetical protein
MSNFYVADNFNRDDIVFNCAYGGTGGITADLSLHGLDDVSILNPVTSSVNSLREDINNILKRLAALEGEKEMENRGVYKNLKTRAVGRLRREDLLTLN